uniref:Uncharacterized protein n=1 Tax=Eutreptiella gymnastica TaxID=73025 RepID=A0A7S1IPN6_9EUGL
MLLVVWFLDRFQPTLVGPRYVVISKDFKQACKLALMADDKAMKAKVTLVVPGSDRDFDSRLTTHAKDCMGYRDVFDSIDHSHDQSLMSRAIPLWIYDHGMHHEDRDIPAALTQPEVQPARTTADPATVAEIPGDENPSPPARSGSSVGRSHSGRSGSRSPSTSRNRSGSRRSLHADLDDANQEADDRPKPKKKRTRKHKETETDEEEEEDVEQQGDLTDQEDADEHPDAGHVPRRKKKKQRHEADEEDTERRTPRKGRQPARFDAEAEQHDKPPRRHASPRSKGPKATPPSEKTKIGSKLGSRLRRGLGK